MSGRSRLDCVRNWVRAARTSQYRVSRLAGALGVSARHLRRYFRERLRKSPSGWMIDVRLSLGWKRISEGAFVKEAAAEAGYASSGNFCRDFRKRFGTTPASVRSKGAGACPIKWSDLNPTSPSARNGRLRRNRMISRVSRLGDTVDRRAR